MKIEVIVYTEINGQRNSRDTVYKDVNSAIREIKKALQTGMTVQINCLYLAGES